MTWALKHSATAGRYRADANSDSKEPEFAEATAIYGLNNTFTLYGGLLVLVKIIMRWQFCIGGTLGASARCRWISTELTPNSIAGIFHGYQWRTQYIKDIPETHMQYRC
ncbi:fimbria/pilus outer membrane usher protein [Escherichia coli]